MSAVAAAIALLGSDFERFEGTLSTMLERQQGYLTATERHLYRAGKRFRPILLLLSARAACASQAGETEPPLPDSAIKAAVSLEMLHVATLIHDDIIDRAPLRRSLPSVSAVRGDHLALLIGDLQFVEAIRGFAESVRAPEDMRLVQLVVDVGSRICRGEIDEILSDAHGPTEALRRRYLTTIDRKTAVLFGLACEAGAALAHGHTRDIYMLSQFGRRVGRAFQVMDDLFDLLQDERASGKAQSTDLARRRLSLPIIYALDELPIDHLVRRILQDAACRPTPADLQRATTAIVASGGFLRAYQDARRWILDAVRVLDTLPPSSAREALHALAFYVVDRGFLESHPCPASQASSTSWSITSI